ncbi:MAG: hypothetical protein Ct9H90mP4_12930 [Gammaproteobacteria bacterium]|nr:MAG: hypothetical protein Ct9H90mP4_12930 [Gammaproteobacteria bacterium]
MKHLYLRGVFFHLLNTSEKIKLACGLFSKKDKPGKKFVYHSTDIYILGAALNNFIKSANSQAPIFMKIYEAFMGRFKFKSCIK